MARSFVKIATAAGWSREIAYDRGSVYYYDGTRPVFTITEILVDPEHRGKSKGREALAFIVDA